MNRFEAALMVGGLSQRMGQDKALLQLSNGVDLLHWQADILRATGCSRLLISHRSDKSYVVDQAVLVSDQVQDIGPIAGLQACLTECAEPLLLVLAIDMPEMTSEFLMQLVRQSNSDTGIVPHTPKGLEPLAAVYPKKILTELNKYIAAGEHSMHGFIEMMMATGGMRQVQVSGSEIDLFKNWNTPDDA